METLKQFCNDSNINPKLIRAVVRRCGGWDSFKEITEDVSNHGGFVGFHGFIYYSDTCKFYDNNKRLIVEFAEQMAYEFGQDVIMFVFGFNCLKGATKQEVIDTLFKSKRYHDASVANALAWFVLEEVSRSYCDIMESN